MRLQNTNGLIQWNLPAALAAASAFFVGWYPAGDVVDSSSPSEASSSEVVSSAEFLPTLEGLASYPTGVWEDPFKHRATALKQLKERKDAKKQYEDVLKPFKDASRPLLVMPVIVLGKQSGPDATDRIQYRHAVENALSLQGFSMDYEERMSYVRIADYKVTRESGDDIHEIPVEAVLPIKLYSDDSDNHILVLWVDNRLLGDHPLAALECLIQSSIGWDSQDCEKLKVAIIGPSYSGELKRFYEEDLNHCSWLTTDRNRIYSPSATASFTRDYRFSGIELVRTIGDNQALIDQLVDELKSRWLLGKKTVLFVENGVASPDDLLEKFETDRDVDGKNVSVIRFLNGLSQNRDGVSSVRDYFARQMQDVESGASVTSVPNEDTALVGIFANATDDKIDIIKAARKLYPAATFFTIDMHARFLELENLPFTRNLLVASHFGLSLQIPKEMLPPKTWDSSLQEDSKIKFRDSYQTSVYFAANVAAYRHRVSESELDFTSVWPPKPAVQNDADDASAGGVHPSGLKPIIFEVGYTGAHGYAERDSFATLRAGTESRPAVLLRNVEEQQPLSVYRDLVLVAVAIVFASAIAGILSLFSGTLVKRMRGIRIRSLYDVIRSSYRFWRFFWIELFVFSILSMLFLKQRPDLCSIYVQSCLIVLGVLAYLELWKKKSDFLRPIIHTSLVAPLILLAMGVFKSNVFEPIAWKSGLSIWPSVIIFSAVSLSASHLFFYYEEKHGFPWIEAAKRISERHATPAWGVSIPGLNEGTLESTSVLDVCRRGLSVKPGSEVGPIGRLLAWTAADTTRMARGISALTLAIFFIFRLSHTDGRPLALPPARGSLAIIIAYSVQTVATLHLFLVVGQSLIQTLSLRRLMAIYDKHVNSTEVDSDDGVRQFLDLTRWIEAVTYASSRGIWLPSVLILAYAWGRLPIWDGWGINSALIYFVLFPLAVTICGAIILRREARELRSTMVARLNALRIANDSNSKNGPTVSSKWIETVASEIGKMRDGAFGNIVHDPVLGSVLIFITTAATGSGNEVFEFARHVLGIV